MERNINSLTGYSLKASNGEIGDVKEFYFDDETWKIEYLVIKTGGWLSGREVLIAPHAVKKVDWLNRFFKVSLTKKQVENSPDIDIHKPVYRQHEIELYDHYAWEGYWLSGFYPGGYLGVSIPFPSIEGKGTMPPSSDEKGSKDDLHLRSTKKVTGYHVHAKDGDIGHIHDFVVDDQTWQLLYLVIDTHNWLGGKKVIIAVADILKVDWDNSKVYVDLTISAVKKSKLFKETVFNPWETEREIKVTLPVIPMEIL
ncbi:PRC-barrel domain-containing protein [Mucilaginibacter paludis]|uniref:PRC-barrel domain protein n=1 Tax=Mucilaginibacter paludis DSM 18603 TaxID=714943 RepID=H1Y814_9SPHI|nr:PRC-barrel domain-containing protein [Mucilaginibacter paludis]EHQ31036.1 PRC-barrel domain protein [Mucilaginibacter paludis DSM 18603]